MCAACRAREGEHGKIVPTREKRKRPFPRKGTAAVVMCGATAAQGSLAERSEAREAVGTYLASAVTASLAPP
jgi:hypothetical protein